MIPRYSRKEMESVWSAQNRFQKWLDIEILVCEALAKKGDIPRAALRTIKAKARFDIARIDEIELTVKHDVIAFLTSVAEFVGPDSRFIHMGLTSSDILDTSLAALLKEASEILLGDVDKLLAVLKKKAVRHKMTLMIGRTHGIHAEPVTFGLKMAMWYEEMARNRERLLHAKDAIACGKISGAVGTFAFIDPSIEEYVCRKLDLSPEKVATQIVQRDRHAEYFSTLAVIASSLEKFATEIRHLQRTEVREAEEYFSPGQKGSSAMPHKRNPVLSENISGLARLMRGYALAAMENVALWHERDISHSSVERIIGPDATILLDFMLSRFTRLIDELVVYPERMIENLNLTHGVIFSQMVLLKLAEKGMTREQAYAVVQENAMRSWKDGIEFKELLLSDGRVKSCLDSKEIESVFRLENFLGNVDYIFKRTFGGKK
ncbi:MAG TPA: adenylosuccinate lyase [Syntrophales bacterium]|nr:adenylosuccinate lyase [Syntrophales bacterium]